MKPGSDGLYSPKEKLTDGRDALAGGSSSSHRSRRYKSDSSRRSPPSRHERTADDYRRNGRHEYRTELSYGRRAHGYREGEYRHSSCRMRRSESSFDFGKGFRSERDRCSWRRSCGDDLKRKRSLDSDRGGYFREKFRINRDVRSAIKAPGGEIPVPSEVKVEVEQSQRDDSEMEEGEFEPEKEHPNSINSHEGESKVGDTPGFDGGNHGIEGVCRNLKKVEFVQEGGLIRGESSSVYEVERLKVDSAAIKEGNDMDGEEDSLHEEIEGIHSVDVDIGDNSQVVDISLEDGKHCVAKECSTGVEDSHGGDGDDGEKRGVDVTFCDIDHTRGEKFDVSEKDVSLGIDNEKGFRLFGCNFVKETSVCDDRLDALEIEPVEPLQLYLSCPGLYFPEHLHDSAPDKVYSDGVSPRFHCSNFQNFVRCLEQDYKEISHIETYSEAGTEVGRIEEAMEGRIEHFKDESSVSYGYGNVNLTKNQGQMSEVVSLGDPSALDLRFMIRDVEPRESGSCLVMVTSSSSDEPGCSSGPAFVDTFIRAVLTEPICVVSRMFQGMSDISLISLKEGVCRTLFCEGNHTKLSEFQKILENRDDITAEMLLKCHRIQLEIMAALRTGVSDFVLQNNAISSEELGEIFLQMRCKNLNCRSSLPVDGHECRICSKNNGFCSSCMCLICSKFDTAYNTCSWVGCDACLHWCHTDCALRESLIRNGVNGSESTHFHCIVCGHPSDMYGFVKEVFESFAKTWPKDTLSEELGCVQRIFRDSVDGKERQIHDAANGILKKLVNCSAHADAYGPLFQLFSDTVTVTGRDGWRGGVGGRGKGEWEEVGEMARMKRAEAEVFEVQAESARREGDGLRRLVEAEMEKIEEEFVKRVRKVDLVHFQESRRQKLQHLHTLDSSTLLFFNMKSTLESHFNLLLFQLQATSPFLPA